MNTFLITLFSVLLIILFAAMTGYLFVRFKWKVNKILFFTMLAAMTVPFQVIMIPLVMIYGNLGLLDSKLVLIFMYIGFGIPLGVFMFHGFIKGRSEEHTSELQSHKLISYAVFCLFFNDTATTEIYTLSLHDALPIFYRDTLIEQAERRT